jgi:hypothetical protein
MELEFGLGHHFVTKYVEKWLQDFALHVPFIKAPWQHGSIIIAKT